MGSIPTEVKRFFFNSCGSWLPLLGLTPSGLFMGSISTLIYTSELILCPTICVHSATRQNIHMYPYFLFATIHHLTYGNCARRSSGSQKLGVLPKRHDNSLSLKTVSKLPWPLQVVNLKIPGLIWRGKVYFVQNNTTIILPYHTRRTTSKVPCRTPAVHFWRQINSLEAQNLSYFSLFTIGYGFWNCKALFVHI